MNQPATDYRPMWEELRLDLPGHDALLSAIPVLYHDTYLTQTGRPEGTPYQIEATSIDRATKAAGIPTLRIDTDHSVGDVGQLSTRVEAFLEMLA